jgi:hypothetical protein
MQANIKIRKLLAVFCINPLLFEKKALILHSASFLIDGLSLKIIIEL